MNRGSVLVSVLVLLVALLIGERVMMLRNVTLAFREVTQNHLPNCQLLKGLEFGSEDITVLEDRLAFISSGLKYPSMPRLTDSPGGIYLLDMASGSDPVQLHIRGEFDEASFFPHGISLYTDEGGVHHLLVVNHPHSDSQVEVFQFLEEDSALLHLKTIKHQLLYNVNDIVAVGGEEFYATNDYYFTTRWLKMLEVLLTLPWCNVVYYSPEGAHVVADGFFGANGINSSPDRRFLYVSDLLNHRVVVLQREGALTLTRIKEVGVASLCDNIEVDRESGDLWLGCHPNVLKMLQQDPTDPPGSEVIRVQNILSDTPAVTQVFSDNGSLLIGSSAAAPSRGRLLIGSVYHRALICDLV